VDGGGNRSGKKGQKLGGGRHVLKKSWGGKKGDKRGSDPSHRDNLGRKSLRKVFKSSPRSEGRSKEKGGDPQGESREEVSTGGESVRAMEATGRTWSIFQTP